MDFTTDRALFDFDVVVVRPYSLLRRDSTGRSGNEFGVEWRVYATLKDEIQSKMADISRLLAQGGLLVVVLDTLEVLRCHTGGYSMGTIYTLTNYDFLDPDFFKSIQNGSGNRVDCNPSDPFSKVIKASSVFWTAFIGNRLVHPFNDAAVFATNGNRAIVGASVEIGSGHVVFLPNFKQLDENSFFEACFEYRVRREGTPPPNWVSSVYLPGKAIVERDIASVGSTIEGLEQERQQKLAALDTLLRYRKLLFEKGKTQLEPIVVRALNDLGFQASPSESIPGTNFEIDGRTKVGSAPGILEIKGSKKQIGLDEFAPFTTKILSDFQATNVHSKGILVGNGLCLEKPETRLGGRVFSPHVLEAAKRNSIALVNTVELYAVVCNALEGLIIDFSRVREQILTTNGYADLRGFAGKSPFSSK